MRETDWPQIADGSQVLPSFPVQVLPDDAARFVSAMAECYQVPADMVACFLLGVASAALVGRVEVQPKHREKHYREAIQLFLLCQGESGERKTPVLNALKRPLENMLEGLRESVKAENRGILREIKALDKELTRAKNRSESVNLMEQRDILELQLKPEPEYILGDMTTEAVCQSMEEHDGKAIALYDEADFLNTLAGKGYQKDGQAVNLLAILSGYNNGSIHGKRVGRGEWHISRGSLSVCFGVQPGLLQDFMGNKSGLDRGLHARFLYFLPSSNIGNRTAESREMDAALLSWWEKTLQRLAWLKRGEKDALCLCFDDAAEQGYLDYWQRVELRFDSDFSGDLRSWAGKLMGNTVRMAGILALLDDRREVRRVHWDAAQTITDEYLIPHARRAFLGAEELDIPPDARALAGKLQKYETFTEAELWRDKGRYLFKDQDGKKRFYVALADLASNMLIRLAENQPPYCGNGQAPSPIWAVHPGLREKKNDERGVIEL